MAHWIQLELEPEGKTTKFAHVDLERVTRIVADREAQAENVDVMTVHYNPASFMIRGKEANKFMEHWHAFVELKAKDEKATPGIIDIARELPNKPSGKDNRHKLLG